MKAHIGFAVAAVMLSALMISGCAAKPRDVASSGSGQPGGLQSGAGGTQSGARAPGGWAGNAGGTRGGQQGSGGASGRRAAVVPVQAMAVEYGVLEADRSTAGVIAPETQSQIAAQVSGVVKAVPRRVGDWVKAGDVVMQLDDSQLRITLANAEASLENAKINLAAGRDNSQDASPKLALQVRSAESALESAKKYYDAQKALFDLGGISASQLDTANSQLATAQANLEGAKASLSQNGRADDQTLAQLKISVSIAQNQADQARYNLQNAGVRAPFDGQIAAISLQPGMYAGTNSAAFTLVSAAKRITFSVAPGDAALLKSGSPVTFSFQGTKFPSRIIQSPSAPISGVVPMVASAPSEAALSYGSVGTVLYRVPLAQGALIPLSSLQTLETQNYVYLIEEGRVSTRNVTVIAEAGTVAAVDGIGAGDTVIVSPPPGLVKGAQVQPTMVESVGTAPTQAAPSAKSSGAGKRPAAGNAGPAEKARTSVANGSSGKSAPASGASEGNAAGSAKKTWAGKGSAAQGTSGGDSAAGSAKKTWAGKGSAAGSGNGGSSKAGAE